MRPASVQRLTRSIGSRDKPFAMASRTRQTRIKAAHEAIVTAALRLREIAPPTVAGSLMVWAGNELQQAEIRAAARLNHLLPQPAPPTIERLWGAPSLWGPRWSGHPFAAGRLFHSVSLSEPQATRELAAWLSQPTPAGLRRTAAFACAILAAAGDPALGDWKRYAEAGAWTTVAAEIDPRSIARKRSHRSSRRNGAIDLYFETQSDGMERALVVEAKLDAPLDLSQLRRYLKQTRARLLEPSYVFLARTAPKRLPAGWRFASWARVMADFENALAAANDRDENFSRFRNELLWRTER